jgi:hypothetical protein
MTGQSDSIRMGWWDCPGCERKRIPGPERSCPSCGKPRDPSVPFYSDEDAPVVTDAAMLERAQAGADWQCPYCGADNQAGNQACIGCGASKDGAKNRATKEILDAPPPPKKAPPTHLLRTAILVLLAVSAAAYFLFVRTSKVPVTVQGATWTKTLELENLVVTRESGWQENVPFGAHEVSRTSKTRTKSVQDGTTRVKVGKKDMGNGFFKDVYEEKPRYVQREYSDAWVTYDVQRWVQGRTLTESRNDGTEPPYPEYVARFDERVRAKDSKLHVALEGPSGKAYQYVLSVSDDALRAALATFPAGRKMTAKINAVGTVSALE